MAFFLEQKTVLGQISQCQCISLQSFRHLKELLLCTFQLQLFLMLATCLFFPMEASYLWAYLLFRPRVGQKICATWEKQINYKMQTVWKTTNYSLALASRLMRGKKAHLHNDTQSLEKVDTLLSRYKRD